MATGNSEYDVRAFRLLTPRTKVGCFVVTKDLSDWTESVDPNISTIDTDLARSWVSGFGKGEFSVLLFPRLEELIGARRWLTSLARLLLR